MFIMTEMMEREKTDEFISGRWCCHRVTGLNCRMAFGCCLRGNKKARILSANFKQVVQEMKISYILRQLRTFRQLIEENNSKKGWEEAFTKHSRLNEQISDDDT